MKKKLSTRNNVYGERNISENIKKRRVYTTQLTITERTIQSNKGDTYDIFYGSIEGKMI